MLRASSTGLSGVKPMQSPKKRACASLIWSSSFFTLTSHSPPSCVLTSNAHLTSGCSFADALPMPSTTCRTGLFVFSYTSSRLRLPQSLISTIPRVPSARYVPSDKNSIGPSSVISYSRHVPTKKNFVAAFSAPLVVDALETEPAGGVAIGGVEGTVDVGVALVAVGAAAFGVEGELSWNCLASTTLRAAAKCFLISLILSVEPPSVSLARLITGFMMLLKVVHICSHASFSSGVHLSPIPCSHDHSRDLPIKMKCSLCTSMTTCSAVVPCRYGMRAPLLPSCDTM
mmetsp:Transcript_15541/g.37839  ORF Transcript_15541/g.37839 Transcript_15541/m.37839 type:complete len:286 (+) Transcript_15541:344-1201(+)